MSTQATTKMTLLDYTRTQACDLPVGTVYERISKGYPLPYVVRLFRDSDPMYVFHAERGPLEHFTDYVRAVYQDQSEFAASVLADIYNNDATWRAHCASALMIGYIGTVTPLLLNHELARLGWAKNGKQWTYAE